MGEVVSGHLVEVMGENEKTGVCTFLAEQFLYSKKQGGVHGFQGPPMVRQQQVSFMLSNMRRRKSFRYPQS